jgi:hypothetical protein
MGTTFELPNFVGDLFSISPESTPLLSVIGGLTGGRPASDTYVSYTQLGKIAAGGADTNARGTAGVPDEKKWQMEQQIKQVARDVNLGFIIGTYANPSDNTTPRKTRGLLQAITTNVKDMGNTTPTKDDILDLFQITYDNGAEPAGRTAVVNSRLKRLLTKLFITDDGLQPLSRKVGGVDLLAFETDFGPINLMLDRAVPQGTLIALDISELAPRFLTIPGKGHFFWEPLAKVGASDRSQLYGEIGLEYGNEKLHAKLVDATTPYDSVGVGSGS